MPNAPHDTSKDVLFAGRPALPEEGGAILAQGAAGQSSLVNSDTLPSEMSPQTRKALEVAGVIFGDIVPGDPLFVFVQLPVGWHKESTDHSLHSNLLDEQGRKRASIMYKAAFYDRHASMTVVSRFSVRRDFEAGDDVVVCYVDDSGKEAYRSDPVPFEGGKYGEDSRRATDEAEEACQNWLSENGYPEWRDPMKYWG